MSGKRMALIIDDDCDIHFFIQLVLNRKGFHALSAISINDALNKIKNNQPSFIFLDNHLPDGSGIDLIPQIRILAPDALIVVMSALFSTQIKKAALTMGADYILEKPFSTDQISEILERALQS